MGQPLPQIVSKLIELRGIRGQKIWIEPRAGDPAVPHIAVDVVGQGCGQRQEDQAQASRDQQNRGDTGGALGEQPIGNQKPQKSQRQPEKSPQQMRAQLEGPEQPQVRYEQ